MSSLQLDLHVDQNKVQHHSDQEVMPLKGVFLAYTLTWGMSMLSLWSYYDPDGSCGLDGGCREVYRSELSRVFGISLSHVGVLVYALPMVLISLIHVHRLKFDRDGGQNEKGLKMSFGLFLCSTYALVGFEIYLIYAQFVLQSFCLYCTGLAVSMFMSGAIVLYEDLRFNLWGQIFSFKRWMLIVLSALLLHFLISPMGAHRDQIQEQSLERVRLQAASLEMAKDHPYEFEPSGVKTVKRLVKMPQGSDLIEKLKSTEAIELLDERDVGVAIPEPMAIVKDRQIETDRFDYKMVIKNRIRGELSAPLRLVVYVNYSCLFCKDLELESLPALNTMVDEGRLMIETKVLDMPDMPFSSMATISAAIAALQGPQAWHKVHQRLFETQEEWTVKGDVRRHIFDLIDMEQYAQALINWKGLEDHIAAEIKFASEVGVETTPRVLLYRRGGLEPLRSFGNQSGEALVEIIERVEREP